MLDLLKGFQIENQKDFQHKEVTVDRLDRAQATQHTKNLVKVFPVLDQRHHLVHDPLFEAEDFPLREDRPLAAQHDLHLVEDRHLQTDRETPLAEEDFAEVEVVEEIPDRYSFFQIHQ